MWVQWLPLSILIFAFIHVKFIFTCNEFICASIVSKCLLTESCNCKSKSNLTCIKECIFCLSNLYLECCSCFEICPKEKIDDLNFASSSTTEDLPDASAELFNLLTEEKDPFLRWTSHTFPVQLSLITSSGVQVELQFRRKITMKSDGIDQEENIQMNCTVAYLSNCLPLKKCKSSCLSMGASSYRWFHDGCCECVGPECISGGINKSQCVQCTIDLKSTDEENNFSKEIKDKEL